VEPLSFGLTTITLCCLGYAVAVWVNGAYIAPARAARAAEKTPDKAASVKHKRRVQGFKPRSARSNVQNAVNAGSGHQDAVTPSVHVQPNVPRSAPLAAEPVRIAPPSAPSAPNAERGDDFTLSPRELAQLAEALHERANGATVEEAIFTAFGMKKGASAGYIRAKALWDAATVAPGAAPEGTYAAARPVRRARRRA
jgi:hypothetical protein